MVSTNRQAFFSHPTSVALPPSMPAMARRPETPVPAPLLLEVMSYTAGETIESPSTATEGLFLIRQGRVRLLRSVGNAPRTLVALLREGEVFGTVTPGQPGQPREFAIAEGNCEIGWVETNRLRSVCAEDASTSFELLSALAAGIRAERQRLVGFTTKDVTARLAATLLSLGATHGESCSHGGQIDLRRITQQDLADMVGSTRSFVSTLINEMKRAGSLGSVGRVLCLRDLDGLRKTAGDAV